MGLTPWVGFLLSACQPAVDDTQLALQDHDGDGWYGVESGGDDCNDDDGRIFPNAPEPCDGVDNDCNNQIDDGATITLYADTDGDTFGTATTQVQGCAATDGWSIEKGDCDDDEATVFPGAAEYCDLHDNDCDGSIDELPVDVGDYRPDVDGDGYGDANVQGFASCEPPASGYVNNAQDCDDANPTVNPTGVETCDGYDNDCDGLWNEADPDVIDELVTQYADADGDGYGVDGSGVDFCWETGGYATRDGDCDGDDPKVHPGAQEVCNTVDDDCDGDVDDDDSVLSGAGYWYVDSDGDGYGAGAGVKACLGPPGRVANDDDCDDTNGANNPSAPELCDGNDNNCNGVDDEDATDGTTYWKDTDEDTYGRAGTETNYCTDPGADWVLNGDDCYDFDDEAYPGADELCNAHDDDCDGLNDDADSDTPMENVFWADADGDNFGDADGAIDACLAPSGYVTNDDDCDDGDATVHLYVTSYPDADGDGFGDPESPVSLCSAKAGYVLDHTDCDDAKRSTHPDASDTWYDGVDSDCDGANDADQDHDGFTAESEGGEDCDDVTSTVHPYAYEDDTDGVDNDCDGNADSADVDVKVTLTMADDDTQLILFDSVTFPFCGTDYDNAWVGSNGYVTFDAGDTDRTESAAEFLEVPRISGFWDDLDPTTAGTIEWIEYSDAVGVYFRGIDVFTGTDTIDMGMIMLADGRIVVDYGDVVTPQTVAGWSCGPSNSTSSATTIWPETDLLDWTYTAPWDSLGIGMGTEEAFYQYFSGTDSFDTRNMALVYCVNSGSDVDGDGWTDACGDPDDDDASVTP